MLPIAIHDTITIPAGHHPGGSTFRIGFDGHPGTSTYRLVDLVEEDLLRHALDLPSAREFILTQLGLDPHASWCLLSEHRHRLLPANRQGKPGDFDLIAGPIRDGLVRFETLVEVEVKVRRVDVDGEPRSAPSGMGTKQARGAAELGFDRVLLLHVLVGAGRPTRGTETPSWAPVANALALESGMRANAGCVAASADDPFGYAILGWAQVPGTDPFLTGGITPSAITPAPFRPCAERSGFETRRRELVRGLATVLGESRPGEPVFTRCGSCGQIFGSGRARDRRCADCGRTRA
jgi:hypothetical protein